MKAKKLAEKLDALTALIEQRWELLDRLARNLQTRLERLEKFATEMDHEKASANRIFFLPF